MRVILIPAAACLVALPVALSAFKEGPYPNVTGGFGEQTCHVCHLDNPINAPGGRLDISGVPPSFVPGTAYQITVTLSREDLKRGGFEISARFASGRQRGRQAGVWRLLDNRVQMIPGAVDKSLQFVQHTLAGSRAPATGANTWTVEWTAPSTGAAPIQFNVAGNATNNDDSPLGDYVYTRTIRTAPATSRASKPAKKAAAEADGLAEMHPADSTRSQRLSSTRGGP